jgi:hypothetical protein
MDLAAFAQYVITILSSIFNAGYFLSYRSPQRRRRLGAQALAGVSLALVVESIFALVEKAEWAGDLSLEPNLWFVVRLPILLSSVLISALILRQLTARKF